jgi:hypothetical protein
MRWRSRILMIVSVAGGFASGCGSDGGLSKAAYLARADAICTATNARLLALGPPRSVEQFGPFAEEAVPVLERGLTRLRGLEAPDEIAARLGDFHSRIEALVAAFRRAAAAARARNNAELRSSAAEAATEADAVGTQARAIGYRVCGRLPGV